MEPRGDEVLTTADSRAAARRVEIEKLDGIAVDVVMPHRDGWELTQKVRASRSDRGTATIHALRSLGECHNRNSKPSQLES